MQHPTPPHLAPTPTPAPAERALSHMGRAPVQAISCSRAPSTEIQSLQPAQQAMQHPQALRQGRLQAQQPRRAPGQMTSRHCP